MKNFCFFLFISISLFLCSCANQPQQRFRIGISQCSEDDWRRKMNDEINREIMFHPEAEVEIRSAEDSNEKQIADIRYFLDNKFDIIIAAPNEAEAITPIIREAYQSGVPVILFDRNINGEYFTAYQGVDNFRFGKSAAHYARHLVGPGAKVLEIYGLAGSTPAIGRHDGFVEGAAEEGMDLLASAYGNWNYENAAVVADSLLNIYSDVDLIYAHNDRMAIAASEVARRRNLDIRIIGIDAAPEIGIKAVADGVIDATFLYPTEGYQLIRTALAILKNEPFDRIYNLPVASPVDKTNADILLLQNKSLKEETEKIRVLKGQVDDFWTRHSAQTTLFYAAVTILLLVLGVLFLVLRTFWQRQRHQKQLLEQNKLLEEQRDAQKALNEQLNAATQSKLMFFTNVSHDLRTPLTLIAEPVEQLAGADNLTPRQKSLMKIADKNVHILRRLINQILDFRKYENGKLAFNPSEVCIAPFLRECTDAFNAVARKRDIHLTLHTDLPDGFSMAVDVEKIERVLFNLISNAFKYTHDNGSIAVKAFLDGGSLKISVADTGKGIAREDLGNIFDRFFQVDKIHPNGSGIGLSLAKAFVELHRGTISVVSTPGQGSTFTVTIPVTHSDAVEAAHVNPEIISPAAVESELGDVESEDRPFDPNKPLLLVIDDNEDMRRMIGELLGDDYSMIFAANGRDGVRLAARHVPDLIICDVMMPLMDGLEFCRIVKSEVSTSHIPVLMLTACSMDEQRAMGYESGADGYVAKPFNTAVLKARCKSLIENRKRIRDVLGEGKPASATSRSQSKPAASAASATAGIDNDFYARFLAIVEQEMGNPDLNVDSLASRMSLGRSQFYRKIKALTNYSPVEILRNLRLRHARELLTSAPAKSISEIAYEVGFSTPAYFTRCYKDFYGETPSELRERLAAG